MPQKWQFWSRLTPKHKQANFCPSHVGAEKITGQSGVGDMQDVLLEWKLQQWVRSSLIMMNHKRVN